MVLLFRSLGLCGRTLRPLRTLLCCLGLGLATFRPILAQAPPPGPEALTYLTEDYAPSNYLQDGELKGIAVEVLRAVWKQMGVPPQPIQVINWARGFQEVETTPDTVLFAMTRRPDRENKFLWVGPIYKSTFVLYSRAGWRIPLATVRDAAAYRIGVLREDIGEKFLLEAGIPLAHLERVAHVRQLTQMLDAGHIDLVCLPAETMQTYGGMRYGDPAGYTPELVAFPTVLYFAFNKATPPGLVARFQEALTRVESERRRIVKKYGGTP